MARNACLFFCLFLTGTAWAGPNENGVLVVHDAGLVYSSGVAAYPSVAPTCSEVDSQLDVGLPTGGTGWIWKVYAVFPANSHPRLKALAWGCAYDSSVVMIAAGPSVPDFEISGGGWPRASGGSIGQSFDSVQTSSVVECYWFGGYAYAPAAWSATSDPTQSSMFVDDAFPSHTDPIAAFASIGFGSAGTFSCPPPEALGGCCLQDGACVSLTEKDCSISGGEFHTEGCDPYPCPPGAGPGACCIDTECVLVPQGSCMMHGGVFVGYGIPCQPSPCPATPTKVTTWGRLKRDFGRP